MCRIFILTLAGCIALLSNPVLSADGKEVFKICQTCHATRANEEKKFGPHLGGILGRSCGTVEGYEYSKGYLKACEASKITWGENEIHAYLDNPTKYLKTKGGGRSKMSFMLKKEAERKAIVDYLKTF